MYNSPKDTALVTAGLIFALIAVVHLYRLINAFPVVIGTTSIPYWASIGVFIIFGLLATWMFSATAAKDR